MSEHEAVCRLVSQRCGEPLDRLGEGTRLFEDLGLDGDAAMGLIEAFSARFGVDLTGFEFTRHFHTQQELEDLLFCCKPGAPGKAPITLGHLAGVAAAGKWLDPESPAE